MTGIRVFISWIRPWISFCIARRNLSRSGAVRASLISISSVSPMSALIMERRRVSPRAAALLAICLSGSPLWPYAAYLVLFPLFALQDCVDLPYALISCVLDVLVADTGDWD